MVSSTTLAKSNLVSGTKKRVLEIEYSFFVWESWK
jgi:hypothetical protein